MNLRLNLKGVWYDMIESGEKKEEYREIKSYGTKRLLDDNNNFKNYETVTFVYGYTSREITYRCNGIRVGIGNSFWGAPENEVYIISIGDKIE